MKKTLITAVLFLFMAGADACPLQKFHIFCTGTQTFYFENVNNPANNLTVTSVDGKVEGWKFNSTLSYACGMIFAPNTCYKIYRIGAPAGAQAIVISFTGGDPDHLTLNYSNATETFTVTNTGNAAAYSLLWGTIANPPACITCNSEKFIIDNYLCADNTQVYDPPAVLPASFTTALTQSATFIEAFNTIIAPGTAVKFDAHPLNGYILFGVGFEARAGAVFAAGLRDGCGPLVPN